MELGSHANENMGEAPHGEQSAAFGGTETHGANPDVTDLAPSGESAVDHAPQAVEAPVPVEASTAPERDPLDALVDSALTDVDATAAGRQKDIKIVDTLSEQIGRLERRRSAVEARIARVEQQVDGVLRAGRWDVWARM